MKDEYSTPSNLGVAKQEISKLKSEVKALGECVGNYEVAIREQQKLTGIAEKDAKKAKGKLDRLIKLVTHNARNSETILNQLGE